MIRILHGDDEFSISESLFKNKCDIEPSEARQSNTIEFRDSNFNLFDIISAANSVPFLSNKRLIIVHDLLAKLDSRKSNLSDEWKDLPKELSNLPGTSDVLFVDQVVLRTNGQGIKSAGPGADVHEFRLPRRDALNKWISNRFSNYHGSATRDVIYRLTQLIGSDLRILDKEIQKLTTHVGNREIIIKDVDLLVSNAREENIFATIDAILELRTGAAMRQIYDLLSEGKSVGNILSLLARQVRLILLVMDMNQRNVPFDEIGKRASITHSYALQKTIGQARKFKFSYLTMVHRKILETDISIKTGGRQDLQALEYLVAEISRN